MENINFLDFISPSAIVLIPVLLGIGNIIKGMNKIRDEYIPLILACIAIVLSIGMLGINYDAVLQGILITLVATGTHQLVKQGVKTSNKSDEEVIKNLMMKTKGGKYE